MYLFFIRDFNDIDHIAPIVWKMARNKYPVAVYCLSPQYDINSDYRLNFLKNLGVDVDYIYHADHQNLGMWHRILRFLYFLSFTIERKIQINYGFTFSPVRNFIQKQTRLIGDRLYSFAKNKYYDLQWASNFIQRKSAKALSFDWVKPKNTVVDVFLTAARMLSVPTLSLPHGVFVYTNDSVAIKSRPLPTFEKLNRYDYVIVQNELRQRFMINSGLDPKRISVLGSTRYCNEWIRQNSKILPRIRNLNKKDVKKLKLVFMTTKLRYRVKQDELMKTLDLLAKFDGIEIVIKPHTRSGRESSIYDKLPILKKEDTSSVELCEWADAILVIGSSIMVEALIQDKPILYLKYLHANTTLYEEFGACWIIHDENELKKAIMSLKADKKNVPYHSKDVMRFLTEFVYAGRKDRDVLGYYEQFIVHCASGKKQSVEERGEVL
jgi:hypothetical protein